MDHPKHGEAPDEQRPNDPPLPTNLTMNDFMRLLLVVQESEDEETQKRAHKILHQWLDATRWGYYPPE